MSRAAAARRLASAAAYGGGGLSLLGASLYGVLRAEAKVARRAIGTTDNRVPDATGWYGRGRPGPAIKIALLGDSSAAGYGVARIEQTPGAWLGSGVAERADRRVHLREFAV
ncbi:MAG: lipolytic enzyme family, partial [Marmoricola sp.]|nr:lipolytic enzyme family [Marmoricola sp.]